MLNLRKRRLAELNGKKEEIYGQMVNELIRKKYSLSEELSILRKKDEKPEEWAEYNAYCEECKKQAKLEVYGEE